MRPGALPFTCAEPPACLTRPTAVSSSSSVSPASSSAVARRSRWRAARRRRAESSGLLAHARLLAVRPRSCEATGRRDVQVRGGADGTGARRREGAASWARIQRTAGGGEAPLLLPRGRWARLQHAASIPCASMLVRAAVEFERICGDGELRGGRRAPAMAAGVELGPLQAGMREQRREVERSGERTEGFGGRRLRGGASTGGGAARIGGRAE